MSEFTIHCRCGEQFHLDERSVGRRIKCRCGRVIEVRRRRTTVGARLTAAAHRWRMATLGMWKPRGPVAQRRTVSRTARLVSRAAWSCLVGVALIAAAMWGSGDRQWPATVLLFIGRWVFLLPIGVVVAAAAVASRRALVPAGLAALVVAGPIMGFRTGWRRLFPAPDGMHFRVVSFNVDGGTQLVGEIPRVLTDLAPDVLALQECGSELATSLINVSGWEHHEAVGMCLLSRYPIQAASVMDRATLESVKRSDLHIGGAGAVVRYTITTPAGPIQFTNLHLETPRKGLERLKDFDVNTLRLNTMLRDAESELARRWVDAGIAASPMPSLVAGDFNTTGESRIFRNYWGDLTDAFASAGIGLGMTKYNGWIRVRIDHVLLGPGWRARDAYVGEDLGSDHRPLIADLTLLRQR